MADALKIVVAIGCLTVGLSLPSGAAKCRLVKRGSAGSGRRIEWLYPESIVITQST